MEKLHVAYDKRNVEPSSNFLTSAMDGGHYSGICILQIIWKRYTKNLVLQQQMLCCRRCLSLDLLNEMSSMRSRSDLSFCVLVSFPLFSFHANWMEQMLTLIYQIVLFACSN